MGVAIIWMNGVHVDTDRVADRVSGSGSGLGFGIRIRIRIQEGKNDPQK
jgi:hypothetical protein